MHAPDDAASPTSAAPTAGPSRRVRLLGYLALALATGIVIRLALFDLDGDGPRFHGHGYCYLWDPWLVSAHVGADVAIGAAYVAIAATLLALVRRTRGALPYSWMFMAFGTFIVACGLTHFMEVWTLWQPVFWLSADLKLITAVASVTTAVVLPPLVPRVLALLEDARLSRDRERALLAIRSELADRVDERTRELQSALLREQDLRVHAEAAARTQEEFLRVVSHELRTPLNAILGWSEVLLEEVPDDERAPGLRAIARNARAQTQLVDDLLDASALDLGKLQVTRARVLARTVTAAAVDAIRFAARDRHQQLTVDVHESAIPLIVEADAARLQQVLVNLLANAVKFTPDGGTIHVAVRQGGNDVVWTVTDSGVGMAPDFVARAFDRFAQGNSSTTRQHGGLGLGLSIARHLVEMHGGTLEAHSEGPGHGATFTMRLRRVGDTMPA
ncbi:sensor histidine kinase [Luteitalea sp.]